MNPAPIYLDFNASTPIDPSVAAAMRPLLEGGYGNPSSGHWASGPARSALEQARRQISTLLGCAADEVVLTSGGSEANNLALNVSFVGQAGADILLRLDGVAASTGSACHAGRVELSPVLRAMGVSPVNGLGAIRFSLGRTTTEDEIDQVVARLKTAFAPDKTSLSSTGS
jgi:cysteine sulfinate desulfinase/cysteine desulfurase-like protein